MSTLNRRDFLAAGVLGSAAFASFTERLEGAQRVSQPSSRSPFAPEIVPIEGLERKTAIDGKPGLRGIVFPESPTKIYVDAKDDRGIHQFGREAGPIVSHELADVGMRHIIAAREGIYLADKRFETPAKYQLAVDGLFASRKGLAQESHLRAIKATEAVPGMNRASVEGGRMRVGVDVDSQGRLLDNGRQLSQFDWARPTTEKGASGSGR